MKVKEKISTYFAKERLKEQIKDRELIINGILKTIKNSNNIEEQINIFLEVQKQFNQFIISEKQRLAHDVKCIEAFESGSTV